MKTNYLLPHKFKIYGWLLLSLGLVIGLTLLIKGYEYEPLEVKVISLFNEGYLGSDSMQYFRIIETGFLNELCIISIILGGIMVGFSKEKIEDEYIYKLRKDSLVWAFITNYVILIIATLFIFDFTFFHVMVFNMFTPLLFFIIRFNFLKLKSGSHEE